MNGQRDERGESVGHKLSMNGLCKHYWGKRVSMGRLKKILIGLIIFFVVFTIAGFFILPPILKSILVKKLSENLHREVMINQIKVNPYVFSATVRGFKVKDHESSEIFLSFDELYFNLQSISVLKQAIIIKEIRLTQPFIKISRNQDLAYNFSDLIEKKETKTAEKPKPLKFSFNNIKIENGSIDFWDGPKQTKHTIRELNIGIPFLSNIPKYYNIFVQPVLSAKVNDIPYGIRGKTKPFADSLETTFDINIKDFNIPYYLAYFPLKLNFKIVSAYLDTKTQLSFIKYKDKGPSMTVSGNVSLKKVALEDVKNNPLFRLPLIEVGIAPTEPLKKIFHLSKVSIQSPELEIKRDSKGVLNIESLLPEKREAQPSPVPEKKEDRAILSIDIDEIELTGGKVSYSDLSKAKPFKTKLDPVEVKIDHFSNGKEKKTNYLLSLKTEANETIRLEGDLSVDPMMVDGSIEVKSLVVKKYSPYYMDSILFDIEDGRLDFSTRHKYEKGKKEPIISLSAMSASLSSLKLKKRDEKEYFFKVPILSLKDTQLNLTKKELQLGSFFTNEGMLTLNRLRNGEFDLEKLFPPSPPQQEQMEQAPNKKSERPWFVSVGKILLDQYTVKMNDQKTSVPITLLGEKIRVAAENLSTAKNASGKISLSLLLDQKGTISTSGTVGLDPMKIEGSMEIKNISLKNYSPYYKDRVLFDIEEGDVELLTNYRYAKREKDQEVKFSGTSISLAGLRLKKRGEGESFINLSNFSIKNTALDLTNKELSIGDVSARKGSVLVRRYSDGKLNLQTLFPGSPRTQEKPSQGVEKPVVKPLEKPWLVKVGKVSLDEYTIKVEDQTPSEPVTINVENLNFKGENISTAQNSKGKLSLSLLLNKKGTISTTGTIGIDPITTDLKVDLKGIEIGPFQSYFTDRIKITVTGGAISTAGNLSLGISKSHEVTATYKGEANLSKFASIDKRNADDFLKWESLSFNDVNVGLSPLLIDIKGISLTDFYARVIINSNGTLNLQDVFEKNEPKKETPQTPQPQEKAERSPKDKEPTKNIKIETITLQGGRVDLSDRSINPEYSSKLVEIGGRVSGLSSEETTLADMELRGKLDDYAPLEITGKINPLKEDLFLDLKVRFKDMDLSPMTPYSGKYVGYTIEKGKLSFDLQYLIEKRKLDSKNYIFLDQFTLGDKVESPHATKLPVKLAIALLKDRKGEIKLDIPVTGTLDDPKFKIGKIILQIIINLITKAVTSPFALLGAIFGGGEELNYLEFDYGSNTVAEANVEKINTLIKVLHERPSVKIDIEGHVDVEKDREGLKQYLFNRKLKAQKLNEMAKKGQSVIPVDEVKIEPSEYGKYLKMAYKEEKFPKPRNVLGMVKDLPVPEMEKLMLTHIEIKEGDLRSLASQRAMKLKDAILKSGRVESERIFIIEPKSLAPEKKEKLKDSRVDLKIK
jgi:hypothetical protein